MLQHARDWKHIIKLVTAFEKDGYKVKGLINKFGRTGILAEHKTAVNYDTGQKKKAYYVEGSSYEMGYLLGCLAESEVASMTEDFAEKVIFSFIGAVLPEKIRILQKIFLGIVYEFSKEPYSRLPKDIRDEVQGLLDGCKDKNPGTKVSLERLIVLNIGFDILCSVAYTGDFLPWDIQEFEPSDFRIPIMCNAFSVFGRAAGGGHYFGRDFMFPTADVFQNTAAMIIYNPAGPGAKKMYPVVSLTAPGMVGSISAMNVNGVAMGVDIAPAGNCNPRKIGINSLLLTRFCVRAAASAQRAVNILKEAERGVSWLYIIADGANDRACIVEAGKSHKNPHFTRYPPEDLKALLPDSDYLDFHLSAEFQNGLMVRWDDYEYPAEYLDYNYPLWEYFNKKHLAKKHIHRGAFDKDGYINKTPDEKNCPSSFFFAPQRENAENLVIATNHYIIPEMRYYSMHPWSSLVAGDTVNDIQWRYDELHRQISGALKQKGEIDFETARKLIDYLAPYGEHPSYHSKNPRSRDGKEIRIEGCTSVFDLKKRTVESHYGYYCDEWVKITLPLYTN